MRRIIFVTCVFLGTGMAHAQFGRGVGDWSTGGGDAHRSSWVRTDPKISKASMEKPGFQFLWQLKFDNNSLTAPSIFTGYIGYRGFRSFGFAGGSADNVYGFDTDLARMEWQKHFASSTPSSAAGSPACPGGMTASVVRQVATAFPPLPDGRGGGGRGTPARSGVGEPSEGAVTLAALAAAAANQSPGRGGPGRGGPQGPFTRPPLVVYALSSDGMLHTMYVSNGHEPEPPLRFLPPNASAQGLVVVGTVAYAATTQACSKVPDGVWALDLTSKETTHWESKGGPVAGSAGPAIAPDGTLYAATGRGELVALDPKTMKVKNSYIVAGGEFTSSPVIFQHKERTLLATSTKDGRIHLLDSTALEPLQKTPASATAGDFFPGALASWQGSDGTRWMLAPTSNAVVAWKLADQNGALSLQPGWVSRGMVSPLTPMIVNGVVFAVSGGSSPVLYALDAASGKKLWSSGKTIGSFVHGGGLSGGGSQVYVGTKDGTLYAFGFPIEH